MTFGNRQLRSDMELAHLKQNVIISAYLFDYDGVLYARRDENPLYQTHQPAKDLLSAIADKGKFFGVITARDASFKKEYTPFLLGLSKKFPSVPMYIAGANGSNVEKIQNGNRLIISEHRFFSETIASLIDMFRTTGLTRDTIDHVSKDVIDGFLSESWDGYIDPELFSLSKKGDGVWWIEKSKMTIALPSDQKKQRNIIKSIRERVKNLSCVVSWAHDAFLHITPKLETDGKKIAVEAIKHDAALTDEEIVTIGDTPHGNDAQLLAYPHSFTNYFLWDGKTPPYILPKRGSPVETVHAVVRELINR